VKPSPRILHSSPAEEKKLGFPFFENGPSAIQGKGATSPFSDLREWEERGVTTPIVLQICIHTQTITISSDLCPPMLTHAIQIAPMYSKLCNVYYPPTPSLGWIRQIKGRSLSLASARSASWLAYSLHPRSLTPMWSWMQGCKDAGMHKTDAYP
jgi:hypothetical protein